MPLKPRKVKRVVSPIELARREWCSRNFRIAGLLANIDQIASELRVDAGRYKASVEVLRDFNNSWGKAQGIKIG